MEINHISHNKYIIPLFCINMKKGTCNCVYASDNKYDLNSYLVLETARVGAKAVTAASAAKSTKSLANISSWEICLLACV